MSGLTIIDAPTPAAAPNASTVTTTPTVTGGVMVTGSTPAEGEKSKLAGKFANVDELEKAYTELQKLVGTPKPAELPVATAIETSGLDLNAIAEEYTTADGKLSDKTTSALTAKGLSVENVQQYVAGQTAIAQQVRAEFAQIAGGEEALKATLVWAKANIPEAEAKAYDAAVTNGDKTVAKMLWQSLVSRYQAIHGKEPSLVTGAVVPGTSGVEPFANYGQVTAAMNDPKYQTDEAYRQKVAKRIAASPAL